MDIAAVEASTSIPAEDYERFERGQALPELADVVKLAQCLGVPMEALLEGAPSLLNYAPTPPMALGLRESEALQRNFLNIEGPDRGKHMKALAAKLPKIETKDSDT